MVSDFFVVIKWWSVLFFIGAAAFPLTRFLFREWHDQGYLFLKLSDWLWLDGWCLFWDGKDCAIYCKYDRDSDCDCFFGGDFIIFFK